MPDERIGLDEYVDELLERVRQQEGLESRDQAAEWLLRKRLRRGTRAVTGRGRALHLVRGGRS